MKSNTKENIVQPVETAGKAVATPSKSKESGTVYDVKPTETVSIVANDRLLFIGKGLKHITIE